MFALAELSRDTVSLSRTPKYRISKKNMQAGPTSLCTSVPPMRTTAILSPCSTLPRPALPPRTAERPGTLIQSSLPRTTSMRTAPFRSALKRSSVCHDSVCHHFSNEPGLDNVQQWKAVDKRLSIETNLTRRQSNPIFPNHLTKSKAPTPLRHRGRQSTSDGYPAIPYRVCRKDSSKKSKGCSSHHH